MVTAPVDGSSGAPQLRVVADLGVVIHEIGTGRVVAAAIDIPIGLAANDPRPVDFEARARLGPRKSSVFPAPVRPVLAATTYEDACRVSRAACGRGVSRQLFAILPKIREVDALQSPQLQERFVEMHPELSFTELAGAPMQFHKRTPEGRAERLHALRRGFPDIDGLSDVTPRGAQPDDVLDAFVGAWSAGRYASGTHLRLGGDVDERGLRMEMIA
jgi:predicted RNase H-like nuclease